MNKEELEKLLTHDIPYGRQNAVHLPELARRWNISTDTVKKWVKKGRTAGLPIMSDQAGYWLSDDEAEKERFVKSMWRQAISRIKTSKPTRQSLKENKDQIKLDDVRAADEQEE